MKKVIVIGLDGLEPKIVEGMLAAGELPHLERIRRLGAYSRLQTTNPAQTPVAWSTFATGVNPGGHGIFDFLSRDPKTYLPILALSRYEQKNAFVPPKVVNMRRGTPVWQILSEAGIPSTIMRMPCTFPPETIKGRILAGVGVPDLRGGLGTGTFYTTDRTVKADHGEKIIHVQPEPGGRVRTILVGPRNPRTRSDIVTEIVLQAEPGVDKVLLQSEGQPKSLELQEGQWSDWLKVKFKTGPLQSVRGIVRFYLRQIHPFFQLYASPINFDPEAHLFPISAPQEYAGELQTRLGTFYTTGMAEDHDGLNNGRFDETAYLDQCSTVLREREKMMRYELERTQEGLFFCLFDTPDRLQHMLWRFREPEHPSNQMNGEQSGRNNSLANDFKMAIEDHYRQCDQIVGEALGYADDQTLVIVLSDHGMNSFQRGLNLNTWLYENGFLALKKGYQPGPENGDFFHNVDWSRTKAYALGLGWIYLNLKGREVEGLVDTVEKDLIKSDLIRGLTGLCDPETGKTAVRSVVPRESIYNGAYADESPDLLVNFETGYRVSWDTPLGGVPEALFVDNQKKWAGDHVIDPSLVPGVLFMNQSIHKENPGLVDLAPTILAFLGVPKGAQMEGENLRS